MTHTPGPWVPHFSPNTGWSVWQDPRQHGDMRTGAIIVAGEVGPQATSYKTHRERKANALLIAGAPELLAALKALHACHRAFSSAENWTALDDEARDAAEAAITKATTPTDSERS